MTMAYYFLKEDFAELDARITHLQSQIREIGAEMGRSCEEGAETYHDNFAFEDGERQQLMWSRHLHELLQVRNQAHIVAPATEAQRVGIGRKVMIEDTETGERRVLQIGSYMVFRGGQSISYQAPLARFLIGAQQGEVREGRLGRSTRSFEVISIA